MPAGGKARRMTRMTGMRQGRLVRSRLAKYGAEVVKDSAWRIALAKKLLRWLRKHARDLPWRRTRDLYAIWLSEVMLQQTQVATVVPYWERFLGRFPDVASL